MHHVVWVWFICVGHVCHTVCFGLVPDTSCVPSSQEKQDKAVLQAEVQHLRQDNMRLQEESQTATAQLRKFTEWFFNTIDKKS